MPMLDACLAFALTMLSLATIATLATEVFVRLMGTRANGLRLMLDDLFQQELWPALKETVNETTFKQLKEQCSKSLQRSPLADLPNNTLWNSFLKFTADWLGLTKLTSLTFDELLKRLPETDLGKKVATLADAQCEKLFDRLTHRYDEFGKAVTNLFTRYAQLFSLIVGIGVAFTMNVDSFRLFAAFQNDAALRGRVVATSGEIFADWEKAQQQVDARRAAKDGPDKQLTPDELKAQNEQYKKQKEEFLAQWKKVNSLDLPIGYDHFDRLQDGNGWLFYGCWALRVILSGLLIGLGGPFWYNIATKLMSVTQTTGTGPARSGTIPANDDSGREVTTRSLASKTVLERDDSNSAYRLFRKFAQKE